MLTDTEIHNLVESQERRWKANYGVGFADALEAAIRDYIALDNKQRQEATQAESHAKSNDMLAREDEFDGAHQSTQAEKPKLKPWPKLPVDRVDMLSTIGFEEDFDAAAVLSLNMLPRCVAWISRCHTDSRSRDLLLARIYSAGFDFTERPAELLKPGG